MCLPGVQKSAHPRSLAKGMGAIWLSNPCPSVLLSVAPSSEYALGQWSQPKL